MRVYNSARSQYDTNVLKDTTVEHLSHFHCFKNLDIKYPLDISVCVCVYKRRVIFLLTPKTDNQIFT